MIMKEVGEVCSSELGVSKTEGRLGCPLLVDGSVCVGGGPLMKVFVMGAYGVLLSMAVVRVLFIGQRSRWAKFFGFGCLRDLGAPLREPMC